MTLPVLVPPTLTNAEMYQFGNTGVVLNSDVSLPFVDIESVEGLDSAPVRQQTHDREGWEGGYVDAEFETIRTITFAGTVYASPTNLEAYLDQLKANFAPSRFSQPLYVSTDSGMRYYLAKSLGFNYAKDEGRRTGKVAFQVQLVCEDPRAYSITPTTAGPVDMASTAAAGRGYPKSYPFGYGAVSADSNINLVLSGNRSVPGVIHITGAVSNPVVINDTWGTTLTFTLALDPGEYLDIDLGNRTVLKNGSENVRTTLAVSGNGWFLLQPGVNQFRYRGIQTPPTPVSNISITAYAAWR